MENKSNIFEINMTKLIGAKHDLTRACVFRITSPKAKRKLEGNGNYYYSLYTDYAFQDDEDKNVFLCKPGIYQVIDICYWKYHSKLQWNIYIVVVEEDGTAYPVEEYIDNPNTLWVKDVRPILKRYFNNEKLEPIELTKQPDLIYLEDVQEKHTQKDENFFEEDIKPKKSKSKKVKKSQKVSHQQPPEEVFEKKTRNNIKKKKKASGRPQDASAPLVYGFARLMTFTGMIIGDYKILRHNKKKLQVKTDKGVLTFSKETGKQLDAKNPRYANKVKFNLDK